jgi:SAM-dependent methyltransferase
MSANGSITEQTFKQLKIFIISSSLSRATREPPMPDLLATPRLGNPTGYCLEYYTRNKSKGLDLLAYGDWQRRYGRWIVDALQLSRRRVLDVGCACGSMLRGMLQAGADIEGVDCSEFFIQMGRAQWPDLRDRLFVCDAVNLHCVSANSFDWLHSCVVAEHWRAPLVPYIFEELLRVVRPGGRFYCAYESGSGVTPNGPDPAEEPTHICLRPAGWWESQLRQAGWELDSSTWDRPLRNHPESFFNEYRWEWFVARRPP